MMMMMMMMMISFYEMVNTDQKGLALLPPGTIVRKSQICAS